MGKSKYAKLNRLVDEAQNGNKKSFEMLCELEAPIIIYTCKKIMGNCHDGEDAAQEVFIQMQKTLPTLKEAQAFTSWIQRLISNACGMQRRKNMKYSSSVPLEALGEMFTDTDVEVLPQEYLNQHEKSRELSEIIDQLPDQVRTCVLMHYFNEMKITEIADNLGISEGSVKGYLYVGREKLRHTLKERDEKGYTHSAALLPMTALSAFFEQEMRQSVSPGVIRRCMEAAGVKSPPVYAALTATTAKTLAVSALCTAAAVASMAAYAHIASPSPANNYPVQSVPQQLTQALAGEDEDMATEQDATTPDVSQPGPSPSGPGKEASVPQEQPPADSPAAESADSSSQAASESQSEAGAVLTSVSGKMAVENAGGADPNALFGNQYYATITQSGNQLALTMINSSGSFTFSELAIAESGQYTLQIHSIYSQGLVFTSDNPGGTFTINLVPGQPYTLGQPIYVVDSEPPVVAITMLTQQGERTAANPHLIEIAVYDITQTTTAWEIQPADGGPAVLGGTGQLIEAQTLTGLPGGTYTLQAAATDALGNQSVATSQFYLD